MSYPITYQVDRHDPPLEKEDIPEDQGACHAVWIGSVIKGESGKSYAFISMDGATGEDVRHEELFQLWVILASVLSENLEDESRRQFCAEAFKTVQTAVQLSRRND